MFREEMLLDMVVAEAAHESALQSNIEGQHGRIGVPKQVCNQMPERCCVGTNQLTWKLVLTLEHHAVVDFRRVQVEVGRQGRHEFVVGSSRWRLGINKSTDSLVRLVIG